MLGPLEYTGELNVVTVMYTCVSLNRAADMVSGKPPTTYTAKKANLLSEPFPHVNALGVHCRETSVICIAHFLRFMTFEHMSISPALASLSGKNEMARAALST